MLRGKDCMSVSVPICQTAHADPVLLLLLLGRREGVRLCACSPTPHAPAAIPTAPLPRLSLLCPVPCPLPSVRLLCFAPLCPPWSARENQVGDEGAAGLGDWLKHNTSLTRLVLGCALGEWLQLRSGGVERGCEDCPCCLDYPRRQVRWRSCARGTCCALPGVVSLTRRRGRECMSVAGSIYQTATDPPCAAAAARWVGECQAVRTLTPSPCPLPSPFPCPPLPPPPPPNRITSAPFSPPQSHTPLYPGTPLGLPVATRWAMGARLVWARGSRPTRHSPISTSSVRLEEAAAAQRRGGEGLRGIALAVLAPRGGEAACAAVRAPAAGRGLQW
jgi:hypothetical protein